MARIRIKELMENNAMTERQMAAILWPDTKPHTQAVLMSKWKRCGLLTVRMDQLQRLYEAFGSTNLIQYEEGEQ